MALGSPVVPEEKRILIGSCGDRETLGRVPFMAPSDGAMNGTLQNTSNGTSPTRNEASPTTTIFSAPDATIFSYNGSFFAPQLIDACVNTCFAPAIRRRVAISSGEKLSAI